VREGVHSPAHTETTPKNTESLHWKQLKKKRIHTMRNLTLRSDEETAVENPEELVPTAFMEKEVT